MIKREIIILTILFAALFLLSGTVTVSADGYDNYGIYVNNNKLDKSIALKTWNGFHYIPLNQMKTSLSMTVVEDKSTNVITISNSKTSIKVYQGSMVELNSKPKVQMTVPLIMKDGNVYFPVMALVDYFGYEAEVMDDIKCIRLKTAMEVIPAGKLVDAELNAVLAANIAASSSYPRVAYLTFDDGLDSKITPQILDILKKEDVKATFFIVGNTIEKNKSLLKRMVAEGHSIGNHTYTHKKENIYSSAEGLRAEIEKTNKAIYDAVGIETNLFRPPYGGTHIKKEAFKAVLSPYRTILWNIDSMDSRSRNITGPEIFNSVVSQIRNKKIVNIIMHDSGTHIETVKALPDIIRYLKDNGFTILPIKENSSINYPY